MARVAVTLVAAGGAAAALGARGSSDETHSRVVPQASTLPAAEAPALEIGAPEPLRDGPDLTRWAPLRHGVAARARPRRAAPVVARLNRLTPEGTRHPLPVHGRAVDGEGRAWLRVSLPVLPNGTQGWIPRRSVGAYELERHRLVVDLDALKLTLLHRGRAVFTARVGIGQERWPTPRGRFIVRNRLFGYDSPMYGPVAFGTSARSPKLTDWPAGGFVGIHGTDRPDLLPGRVSHGCLRLRNADMRRLARLLPVGTPVTIR
jgi:hypothetical protein